MSVTVEVNDPAYPPGTEISVAGIRTMFKNGETAVIEEAHVFGEDIGDMVEYLKGVAGFTVKESDTKATGGVSSPSSQEPAPPVAPPVAVNVVSGTPPPAATTAEGSESQ